jgi:hypothetical protein
MDASAHGKLKGPFWGPLSHTRKWRYGDKNNGEAFWGSSRWFVFLTDGWHLMQFFCFNFLILALLLYKPMTTFWLDFVIMQAAFRLPFYVIYEKILSR